MRVNPNNTHVAIGEMLSDGGLDLKLEQWADWWR